MSGIAGTFAVVLSLMSALVTFLVLTGLTPILPTHAVVVWALIGNGILVVVLIGIVLWEAWAILRARRAGAAAAGIHVRIVSLFSLVAAFPAILVALVASITLERGLDPWFTNSLKALIANTSEIADAYRDSQCRNLARETDLMAADLNRALVLYQADKKLFQEFFRSRAIFLGFPVAMLLKPDGTVVDRVVPEGDTQVPMPNARDLAAATARDPVCIIPQEGNLFRSVLKLEWEDDTILYVMRPVDPRAVEFPAAAEVGVAYYQALEEKKVGIQIAFASMFALVALIVLLSAVWFGLSLANRLVAPIRRLIHASDQVASGNFYVRVPVLRKEGDLGHLSTSFNKMTSELRRQHDGLLEANEVIDERRRFTEAVLAGVSAGVIGADGEGVITIVNRSGEALLGTAATDLTGRRVAEAIPEIAGLMDDATANEALTSDRRTATGEPLHGRAQGQVSLSRGGRDRMLNVRVTSERDEREHHGFVITLDDITGLVAAQRTAAWADVARRIAHEIKNPLTPIQLSAERIRRKYGKVIVEDKQIFDQCVETIVRQVDDIKRMVDEFSSFARMPKPAQADDDIVETVRQVLFLMRVGSPDLQFTESLPDHGVIAYFDRRLLSQALTNIVKNATEAVKAVPEEERGPGVIHVEVREEAGNVVIEVTDNGKGFPRENRQRLLEPYMTTREGGTGLGLAIVGKILEDHGGGIQLLDNSAGRGGRVVLWLPVSASDTKPAKNISTPSPDNAPAAGTDNSQPGASA
ncbi:PAS domain-containing sensor histidine kinase [Pseudochelatococcus contaminans]|uniref:histidine kinase n=1 Tax=Pseudochelatococcus contaminans TaxID=1538103 RepID=A0A7W5Z1E4_9HYPH|nr:two-component system nitrogen regulation sensor histidine kinase NtrY [Pseudochelatococcus contaminans]